MGIFENCTIYFDNKNGVYNPGEILTGRVVINFSSPKKVNEIFITIVGKSTVYWTESDSTTNSDGSSSTTSTSYTNKETYFEYGNYLVGQQGGVKLSAGQHVYPFRYLLPPNIPPSFIDRTKTGKIIYTVKVTLDRPWRMSKYIEVPFVVQTLFNIHHHPLARAPGMLVMEKQFGLIFKSNPLKTVVKIRNCSLAPGQAIPLIIEVDNSSDTAVNSISFKLRQIITYHAKRKSKKVEQTLSKNHIILQVRPNTSTSLSHTLPVPYNLIFYNLTNCKIIDMTYEIKVELHTSGLTRNLIGTMPLHPVKI